MFNSKFMYLALMLVLLYGCAGQNENKEKPVLKKDTIVEQKTISIKGDINYKLNDVANFIAGLEVRKESDLYALSQSEIWKKYHEESQKAWDNFKGVAEKYKSFSQNQLKSPFDTIKTLFYPFSGPDFLFANILFPKVENMVLIGLESPGSVPTFLNESPDSLNKILQLYKKAIEDVVQLSFFRTVDMAEELDNRAIDGTTPIIMLFLVRSGKEIVSVQKSYFSVEGEPVKTDDNKIANAVVIKYREPGQEKLKNLTYISTNLADPSLKKNKPVLQYLKNIPSPTLTFVKSATYLMHKPYFSVIRNTCLNKSAIILQDDSGISFQYFDKEKWDFQFFGTYSKPIEMFSMFFQEDYLKAFKSTKAEPLDFRIGYNRSSNLLLATRK